MRVVLLALFVVLSLLAPVVGASCHACIDGVGPVQDVWAYVWHHLP